VAGGGAIPVDLGKDQTFTTHTAGFQPPGAAALTRSPAGTGRSPKRQAMSFRPRSSRLPAPLPVMVYRGALPFSDRF
jgi:hypothetical protein